MKNREIKRLLKEKASSVEVKTCDENLMRRIQQIEPVAISEKKNKSRFYALAGAVSFACICGVGLLIHFHSSSDPNVITIGKTEETLAFQLVSMTNFVSMMKSDSANLRMKKAEVSSYRSIAEEINQYLYTIEQFNNKASFQMAFTLTGDDYFLDIRYQNNDYRFIYDEIKKDEHETEFVGTVSFGEEFYRISGEKKEKSGETELELSLYLSDEEYIHVEQEIEKRENEYEYSYYKDKKLISSFSLEIDGMNSGLSLMKEEEEVECEFEYDNGVFVCEYESTVFGECEVRIISEADDYIYHFDDENEIRIKKLKSL